MTNARFEPATAADVAALMVEREALRAMNDALRSELDAAKRHAAALQDRLTELDRQGVAATRVQPMRQWGDCCDATSDCDCRR